MSFKELSLFNEALLAKQTWRLLHNKISLFYRVFKSRFCPNCSITDAKEGHGGSYAWKNILKCQGMIRRGAKWRVGNGESIKIWGDNWLPIINKFGVHGPLTTEFQDAAVSTLIDPFSHTWDHNSLVAALGPTNVDLAKKTFFNRGHANESELGKKKRDQ